MIQDESNFTVFIYWSITYMPMFC